MIGSLRRKRDEVVDTIRTVCWFRIVENRLGLQKARQIQRAVGAAGIGRGVAGDVIKNNKFLDYSKGKHVPHQAVVEQIELMVPRSERELNHPLWMVLRTVGSVRKKIDLWMRQLDPDIQRIAISPANQVSAGINRHVLGSFERRAGMDSLAALTMLWRLGYEEGNAEWVWLYAKSIFRVLLLMGAHFERRGVAVDIFQLFVDRVFSLSVYQGKRLALENYDYLTHFQLLELLVDEVKARFQEQRVRKMPTYYALLVLNGKCGPRAQSAFNVPVKEADS